MAIQRIGEKLIKRSFFVERDDYELLVKYSELKNQSISATFRELMSQSRKHTLGRIEKIEQEKFLVQEAIRKHEAEASTQENTESESKLDQFADYRALDQTDNHLPVAANFRQQKSTSPGALPVTLPITKSNTDPS